MGQNIEVNDISGILSRFLELFKSEPKYFSYEITKFERINERLINSKIDIGIIGITSSGKSTFLNAILGDKLLPQKVRPSSGVQVLCERGPEKKAIIIFKPHLKKNDEIIVSNISKELERYGDETGNPNNEKGVEEIRLFSPDFRLHPNITLVDTPGLDAYGLKNHEKITLQLVLPTVQMILFLTTVKATSDSKNVELIDQITSDNKPMIVVQNMIDSIVPKESSRRVEKTIPEIQVEHYNRLKKLLQKSQKESVKTAPVVQTSAIYAMQNWKQSGMKELESVLKEQIEASTPGRLRLFVRQIARELESLTVKIDTALADQKEAERQGRLAQEKLDEIKHSLEDCQSVLNRQCENIINKIKNIASNAEKLIEKIENKYRNNHKPESLDQDIKREIDLLTITKMNEISDLLTNAITILEKPLNESCNILNLQTSEITTRHHFNRMQNRIEIPIEPSEVKKVKRKTLGGKFKRLFGQLLGEEDWGYDDVKTSEWINIEKLINNFKQSMSKFINYIEANLTSFKNNTEYALEIMNKELEANQKNARNMHMLARGITPALAENIKQKILAFCKLTQGCNLNNSVQIRTNYKAPLEFETTKQSCSRLGINIFKLAHHSSFKPLQAYRNKIMTKCVDSKNIVIWGWDTHHLNRFVDYFFSDMTDRRLDDSEHNFISEVLIVVNDSIKGNHPKLKFQADTVFFVLLNAIQIGDTSSKFNESELQRINGSFVWVMDSIKEHIDVQQNNLMEGFHEVIDFVSKYGTGKKTISFMASDHDLYYSVLLHELYFNSDNWHKTHEQHVVEKFRKHFHQDSRKANLTGEYIKQYKALNSKKEA